MRERTTSDSKSCNNSDTSLGSCSGFSAKIAADAAEVTATTASLRANLSEI